EKGGAGAVGGKDKASPGDLLEMASMCQRLKRQFRTAAQLYQEAFEARPALLTDQDHLFKAACAAALAAAGQGERAGKLTDREKAPLRRQARSWLEAGLRLYAPGGKAGRRAALLQAAHPQPQRRTDP